MNGLRLDTKNIPAEGSFWLYLLETLNVKLLGIDFSSDCYCCGGHYHHPSYHEENCFYPHEV